MIIPVILSGGVGTRLWPLSRQDYPKQLLPLTDNDTLLQKAIKRATDLPDLLPPLVLCSHQHRFLVAEQLAQIKCQGAQIILEPEGKDTAPAVAVAALYALADGNDPLLLILPADHIVDDKEKFTTAISVAVNHALAGHLITFGITPTTPETGYGYIKVGKIIDKKKKEKEEKVEKEGKEVKEGLNVYQVEKFVEKPDLATAKNYLETGEYFWNSGMFMFKASCYLAELKKFAPGMVVACQRAIEKADRDLDFLRLNYQAFAACPANSIDYAVMEKTTHALVIPLATAWSDVGNWSALWALGPSDKHGNVIKGDVTTYEVKNSYLRAESRLLAVVGVDDHVVIETPDAVLVAHKDNTQAVKNLVHLLKSKRRQEIDSHRRTYRPWGFYETIHKAERFQVKRIVVKPGASLSLQLHHHRSEHWVVVRGTAEVINNDKIFILTENQSTHIPIGSKHRLSNIGKISLEVIEVQSGAYLEEDDIVRFDDIYGRIFSPNLSKPEPVS